MILIQQTTKKFILTMLINFIFYLANYNDIQLNCELWYNMLMLMPGFIWFCLLFYYVKWYIMQPSYSNHKLSKLIVDFDCCRICHAFAIIIAIITKYLY